jgi:hypothetical protein
LEAFRTCYSESLSFFFGVWRQVPSGQPVSNAGNTQQNNSIDYNSTNLALNHHHNAEDAIAKPEQYSKLQQICGILYNKQTA